MQTYVLVLVPTCIYLLLDPSYVPDVICSFFSTGAKSQERRGGKYNPENRNRKNVEVRLGGRWLMLSTLSILPTVYSDIHISLPATIAVHSNERTSFFILRQRARPEKVSSWVLRRSRYS